MARPEAGFGVEHLASRRLHPRQLAHRSQQQPLHLKFWVQGSIVRVQGGSTAVQRESLHTEGWDKRLGLELLTLLFRRPQQQPLHLCLSFRVQGYGRTRGWRLSKQPFVPWTALDSAWRAAAERCNNVLASLHLQGGWN